MTLYHLDPRQAGTGAAADVETRIVHGMWTALDPRTGDVLARTSGHEPAALRAAREAAGFGHVHERACDEYEWLTPFDGPNDECVQCAWPRGAHAR